VESRRIRLTINLAIGALVGMFVLFSASGIYLYLLSRTLPDLEVDPAAFRSARTSVVYAADGSVLTEWHGAEDRKLVSLDRVSKVMRDAVVAIEDERFYMHHGVDTEAIARALKVNTETGDYSQGGSTITQQVVKVLFLGRDRTITRKVREALLAFQLETKADKDKVLETYLNVVYFGGGSYGVESASRRYFGRAASDLSLPEAALLAAVIRSPAYYSPTAHPENAVKRRNVVLKKMFELGYISEGEQRDAAASPLGLAPPREVPEVAPYFIEYVKQDLIDRLGADKVFNGGLRVHTSLELRLQKIAEHAAWGTLNQPGDPEVSVAAVDHRSGRVLAMVGGRDYKKDQFNLASQGRRQPGSAFKPFVLVAALERGVSADQVFSAAPYSVQVTDGVWRVQNYENARTAGSLTLRSATMWSVNTVYARLIMKVGPKAVVRVARSMGIVSPVEPNPAIALGGLSTGVTPLEMAAAYGTIATGGLRFVPTGVVKVTDDRGRLVYAPDFTGKRAIPQDVAVRASLMLHEVVTNGTGTSARIPQWAAGKTGTTQSYRDAWFVGYAGDVSTAVWVGHRDGQVSMTDVHGIKVTGGSFPAIIWREFMRQAASYGSAAVVAPVPLPGVSGSPTVVRVRICDETFLLANPRCPNTTELELEPGLVPKRVCDKH